MTMYMVDLCLSQKGMVIKMKKTYTLGLYEKAVPETLSWREKLEVAKEVGYDFVEISIDASEAKINRVYMSKEERFDMVKTMNEVGVPIRTMCVSALTKYSIGNDDKEICDRGMEIAEKSIELAADLGVRIVMIPGYDVYYGESTAQTQTRFVKNLRKVAEIAAKHGVMVGLETMENSFMNTVWKAMYYVREIDSMYLGVYPDSGNLKNAAVTQGSDEIGDILSGKGHVCALHLKETVPGIFREIEYGTGHVNFEKNIDAAWKLGVRRFVTEFWYTGKDDWKTDVKKAFDMATKLLVEQERRYESK